MPGQVPQVVRPYNVGQHRAKQQLKFALTTRSNDSKLRRLEQVLASNTLDRKDTINNDLRRMAVGEITELKLRLANVDEILNIKVNETCKVDRETLGRAPQGQDARGRQGDFSWLRSANDQEDRAARREVSALTERAISCRGYAIGQLPKVALVHVESMLEGTCLISPSKGIWPADEEVAESPAEAQAVEAVAAGVAIVTQLRIAKSVVYQEAVKAASEGKRVVAVNAASAYHLGGGFKTGGRHALEEAMCVQSSLYASLKQGARLAEEANVVVPDWVTPAQKQSGADWLEHIPDDGVVFSPHVEVFRGGTNDGYPFQDSAVKLEAVISVAMPNCNDRMSDSPVDAHPDPVEYKAQLQRKWRAVFTAAARYTQGDTLVVPDAGCGVFRNPPDQVGAAFGQVLRDEFPSRFKEIVIAFPGGRNGEAFAEYAQATFEGRAPQRQE